MRPRSIAAALAISAGGESAVHGQGGADDEGGGRAARSQDGVGDLVGGAQAADGLLLHEFGHGLVGLAAGRPPW
ncbi:hypothetical protein [Nonomuraea candida]|uniref:hypothetical protein n=1 Tax=Nonomuraea candida TaxID=359159 RepID=UPI0005BCED4A|nr:hypothetical protein [Nonomuraea candida]